MAKIISIGRYRTCPSALHLRLSPSNQYRSEPAITHPACWGFHFTGWSEGLGAKIKNKQAVEWPPAGTTVCWYSLVAVLFRFRPSARTHNIGIYISEPPPSPKHYQFGTPLKFPALTYHTPPQEDHLISGYFPPTVPVCNNNPTGPYTPNPRHLILSTCSLMHHLCLKAWRLNY